MLVAILKSNFSIAYLIFIKSITFFYLDNQAICTDI